MVQVKLLREVENEVLSAHQSALLQKEHSGCAALLKDDKVEGWAGQHMCTFRLDWVLLRHTRPACRCWSASTWCVLCSLQSVN